MKPKQKPIQRGRDASSGRIITVAAAKARPSTAIVETVKPRKRRAK